MKKSGSRERLMSLNANSRLKKRRQSALKKFMKSKRGVLYWPSRNRSGSIS